MSVEEIEYKYALKTIFHAHAADVRVIKPTRVPEDGIVTGSRDHCVKVWSPDGRSFKEIHNFCGATNYISSLCILPTSDQYPTGLILAGSHDCSIYAFIPDSPEPIFKLLGHSATVCTLSRGKYGLFVSGSWDKTARVWSGQQCVLVLQGHTQAVWATDIFPSQNLILTGSADHTIRLWRSGICEKVFTGHTDCVRGLAIISDLKFLSCSNDSTVRLWSTGGECLEVYKSHNDYIYDITLLSNGTDFATCGEDQTIKIWKKGRCVQTVVVQPKSLWSIACLDNGDLAVATSDGKVYIMDKVPVDYFEKASKVEKEEMPISESKKVSGTQGVYDGETIIMYENESTHMYRCKYYQDSGLKVLKQTLDFKVIAELFGKASNENSQSAVPQVKADFVFDVEVENKVYKLHYNKGENIWDVARNFVTKYHLSSEHVAQIVDYIIQNAGSSFMNEFYPIKTFLFYLNLNVNGMKETLLGFSKAPNDIAITPEEIDMLIQIVKSPDEFEADVLSVLDKVILWKDESIFPVLDMLRVAVRNRGLQPKLCSKDFVNHLLNIYLNTNLSINRVLIQKIFCNMFDIDAAQNVLSSCQERIFECIKIAFSTGDLNIQKAGSAVFLNFAVAAVNGFKLNVNEYCLNIMEILNYLVDSQAIIRVLMAIGTICSKDVYAVTIFRSLEIKDIFSKFNEFGTDTKVGKMLGALYADF